MIAVCEKHRAEFNISAALLLQMTKSGAQLQVSQGGAIICPHTPPPPLHSRLEPVGPTCRLLLVLITSCPKSAFLELLSRNVVFASIKKFQSTILRQSMPLVTTLPCLAQGEGAAEAAAEGGESREAGRDAGAAQGCGLPGGGEGQGAPDPQGPAQGRRQKEQRLPAPAGSRLQVWRPGRHVETKVHKMI